MDARDFLPPEGARAAAEFAVRVVHSGSDAEHFEVLRDDFAIAREPDLGVNQLPPFDIILASDGTVLVPVQRGPQDSSHRYWEFLPEPGRVWRRPGPQRAMVGALPFALKEINQNCVHYGLLRFEVSGEGVLQLDWQIASETCQYLKFNAWGHSDKVRWQSVDDIEGDEVLAAYAREVSRRLPVKPIDALEIDHPGVEAAPIAPESPADATVWGLVVDGVHYRGGCQTRYGLHPYCEVLALPSYSTAKSLFAGLSLIVLAARFPELESMLVTELVPECALPDGRWQDVRLRQLLNMSSGNFDSATYQADEDSPRMSQWFLATSNADKLRFACEAWLHQATPGTVPVYHSTDTYLLGVALNRFLKRQQGAEADLHRDLFYPLILGPAQPGPLLRYTQRSLDAEAQPFTSHGLLYHPDDVARIGQYLLGPAYPSEVFPPGSLDGALFQDRGGMLDWGLPRGEGYIDGFWGFDIAPWLGCATPAWIPFMSGYGGIIWALLPNGMVYYTFGDGGHGPWMDAVLEAHKIAPICNS